MIHHHRQLTLYPSNKFMEGLGQTTSTLFRFTDKLAEADLLVHPADHDFESQPNRHWTHTLLELTGRTGKAAIVFNNEDKGYPIGGFYNIMHSGHRDWPAAAGIASPGWSPLTTDLTAIPLPTVKRGRPKVNFCGSPNTASIRVEVVNALKASGLDKEVIERPKYFYCMFDKAGTLEERDGKLDFLRTMRECDYNLCVRGHANTAYRMYETLCAGRIPVVIDTGTLLPRPELDEWGLCCWVTDVAKLEESVLAHYKTVDLGHYRRCRRFWADHLSVPSWFRWLHSELEKLCPTP